MKDIVISGSTYKGVEQLLFKRADGGTARFIDADVKSRGETACELKSFAYGEAFNIGTKTITDATPKATMTLEE